MINFLLAKVRIYYRPSIIISLKITFLKFFHFIYYNGLKGINV